MKVIADREICMAAGVCVMTADAVFDQDPDGLVVLATGTSIPDALSSIVVAKGGEGGA